MNKVLLHCHKTNLTREYLATVVKSYKTINQLLINVSINLTMRCKEHHISLSREEGGSSLVTKEAQKFKKRTAIENL